MFTITDCPVHGSVSAPDFRTFALLLPVALDCVIGREADDLYGTGEHAARHARDLDTCWACCNLTVLDPNDVAPALRAL